MIDAFIKHINILMNDGGKLRNFSEIKISQVCIIVPDRAFIFGVTTRNQPDKRRFSTAASAHSAYFFPCSMFKESPSITFRLLS